MRTTSGIVERFVDLAGVRTRTLEVAGEGPPLLLLHGFTDSADCWRPVLDELAGANRRAVAVDLPGHGHAEAMGRPVLGSLDRFVHEFVVTYCAGTPAVLAGNSLGGLLALRAAGDPGLALAAVSGVCPAGLGHHRRLEVAVRVARILYPVLRLVGRLRLPPAALQRGASRSYARLVMHGVDNPDLARRYGSHLRAVRDLARISADLLALADEVGPEPIRAGTPRASAIIALEAIQVPVLLLWGGHDGFVDVDGAASLLAAAHPSTLVVLDDCGHCPQLQRPDEVARLLAALPESVGDGADRRPA